MDWQMQCGVEAELLIIIPSKKFFLSQRIKNKNTIQEFIVDLSKNEFAMLLIFRKLHDRQVI